MHLKMLKFCCSSTIWTISFDFYRFVDEFLIISPDTRTMQEEWRCGIYICINNVLVVYSLIHTTVWDLIIAYIVNYLDVIACISLSPAESRHTHIHTNTNTNTNTNITKNNNRIILSKFQSNAEIHCYI